MLNPLKPTQAQTTQRYSNHESLELRGLKRSLVGGCLAPFGCESLMNQARSSLLRGSGLGFQVWGLSLGLKVYIWALRFGEQGS